MIERPTRADPSQLDEADFRRVDKILEVAETAMLAVASEHLLREMRIQRGRWDQPEILMSWIPIPDLPLTGKNIRAFVRQDGQDSFSCIFESNAWSDRHETPDSFTRYWDHFPGYTILHIHPESTLGQDASLFLKYVERAYETVSDSSRIMLSHAIQIYSNGETRSLSGSAVITGNSVKYHPSRNR